MLSMDDTSKILGRRGTYAPEPALCEGAGGRSDSSSSPHSQANELLRILARLLAHDSELQQPELRIGKASDQPKGESE